MCIPGALAALLFPNWASLPILIAAVIALMHGPRLLLKELFERKHSVY